MKSKGGTYITAGSASLPPSLVLDEPGMCLRALALQKGQKKGQKPRFGWGHFSLVISLRYGSGDAGGGGKLRERGVPGVLTPLALCFSVEGALPCLVLVRLLLRQGLSRSDFPTRRAAL